MMAHQHLHKATKDFLASLYVRIPVTCSNFVGLVGCLCDEGEGCCDTEDDLFFLRETR